MSAEAAEAVSEDVATPISPDAGKEVWCENGCGNRFLEPDEHMPFPCPSGCGGVMTDQKPLEPAKKTVKVTLPTLGRIVHLRVGASTWRPAIVMGADPDGTLLVHAHLHENDPRGALRDGIGNVKYGSGLGQWTWPSQEPKQTFDAAVDA